MLESNFCVTFSCNISFHLVSDNCQILSVIVPIINVVIAVINTSHHQRAAETTVPTCKLHVTTLDVHVELCYSR